MNGYRDAFLAVRVDTCKLVRDYVERLSLVECQGDPTPLLLTVAEVEQNTRIIFPNLYATLKQTAAYSSYSEHLINIGISLTSKQAPGAAYRLSLEQKNEQFEQLQQLGESFGQHILAEANQANLRNACDPDLNITLSQNPYRTFRDNRPNDPRGPGDCLERLDKQSCYGLWASAESNGFPNQYLAKYTCMKETDPAGYKWHFDKTDFAFWNDVPLVR